MFDQLRLLWAKRWFRARRAHYYEYLAILMEQLQGKKTLRDIFTDDAQRYGTASVRGYLSGRWARLHEESGGDLAQTFVGSLPSDDIALMRAAQLSGAGALGSFLYDLARTARLHDKARRVFRSTLMAGLAASVVMLAVLAAIPWYTAPALLQPFQSVPPEFYGNATRKLLFAAEALDYLLLPLVLGGALTAAALLWSLSNLTGRVRMFLDRFLLWRVYRDFQGILFLSLLSITVRQRGNVSTRLRDAIMAQLPGANRWKAWHLNQMVVHIDDGIVGAETVDTGMLDHESIWFLADMIAVHGLDGGLQRARERIEDEVMRQVTRRAWLLRWLLLGIAVAVIITVTLWHYVVVDEMSSAMRAWHAI